MATAHVFIICDLYVGSTRFGYSAYDVAAKTQFASLTAAVGNPYLAIVPVRTSVVEHRQLCSLIIGTVSALSQFAHLIDICLGLEFTNRTLYNLLLIPLDKRE
jgi:hypothetical protein